MRDLIICGAGGHGAEIASIVSDMNESAERWNLLGFVDPSRPVGAFVDGVPVLGGDDYLTRLTEPTDVIIAVANPRVREGLYAALRRNDNLSFPILIHPLASVAKNASVGEGCVISQFCIVSPRAVLDKHVFLHGGAFVGHDATIGDFSLVMPHASVLGSVTVGKNAFIGAHSSIRQGLTIGENSVVGMGGVVVKDVARGSIVVGNPAETRE